MKPSDAQLRPLIVKKLSADEIRGVCFDYFPAVYDDLTPGMTKSQMAELLVGYCCRHGLIPNLRTALHAINPNTFPLVEQIPNPAQLEKQSITDLASEKPDTYIEPISGKEMLRVPTGKFLFGDDKQEMELPEFWISKTPVTNAEYARFLEATNHLKPKDFDSNLKNKKDHPVVYVNWFDAQAYCKWAGGDLPTEEQWEKAARGPHGLAYPWGNEWENGRCNTYESGILTTTPVGQFSPQGDSPYSCVDMSGNVWEWTTSLDQTRRVVRGGSWKLGQGDALAAYRLNDAPDIHRISTGFRVVLVRRSLS